MAAGADGKTLNRHPGAPTRRGAPTGRSAAIETGTAQSERAARTLTRQDWVLAARGAFIKGGIHTVKVDHLAHRLGVTRGSFYFHFRGRPDLLDALFQLWRTQNAEPFEAVARDGGITGWERILRVVEFWLEEAPFSPEFDSAMRDWARTAKHIADAVRAADQSRIALFDKAYREMGFPSDEAFVRARVTYSQQVGYYALGIRETKADRRRLLPLYHKILALRPEGIAGAREGNYPC